MTRRVVYGAGLWCFTGTIALTLACIILPTWITHSSPTSSISYGLHKYCTSYTSLSDDSATATADHHCRSFPRYSDCHGPPSNSSTSTHFCSLWRSASFLLSLAFILELAAMVSFVVVLLGGKQKRVKGWTVVAGTVGLAALAQAVGFCIIGALYDREERFAAGHEGWKLGPAWWMALGSTVLQIGIGASVVASKYLFQEEGGYELIPDEDSWRRDRRQRDRSGGWASW